MCTLETLVHAPPIHKELELTTVEPSIVHEELVQQTSLLEGRLAMNETLLSMATLENCSSPQLP